MVFKPEHMYTMRMLRDESCDACNKLDDLISKESAHQQRRITASSQALSQKIMVSSAKATGLASPKILYCPVENIQLLAGVLERNIVFFPTAYWGLPLGVRFKKVGGR